MTSPGRNFEPVVVKAAVLAIGVVVVRTLDDAFIHPAAGVGAGDHLLSGLVPVAAGLTAAAVILRTRGWARSFAALMAGFWGLVASMELFIESGPEHGGLQPDDLSAILSLVAGFLLVGAFGYFAWRSESRGRNVASRSARRSLAAVALTVAAFVLVFPLGLGYMATHYAGPGLSSAPDLGVPVEHVEFPSSDGLELTGWYVPTQNGAVVVVLPGVRASTMRGCSPATATASCW